MSVAWGLPNKVVFRVALGITMVRDATTGVLHFLSDAIIPAVIDRRSFISLSSFAFRYETLVDETVTVPVTIPSSPKVAITIA